MGAIAGIIIVCFLFWALVKLVPQVATYLLLVPRYFTLLYHNTVDTFTPGSDQYRYRKLTIWCWAIFGVLLLTTIVVVILQ